MPNTNFQTIHQMGNAINKVVKQATGRDPVENIDMDYVTVAQNKTMGELTIDGNPLDFNTRNVVPFQRILLGMEPQQSGSGDPSPENIRPIIGRNSVRVTRTGKNMLSPVLYKGLSYNPSIGAVFNTELSPLQFSPGMSYGAYQITPQSTWQYYSLLFPVVPGQRCHAYINGHSTGNFGRSVGYLDKDMKVLTVNNETASSWIYSVNLNPANTPGAAYWYMVITNRSSASPTMSLTFPQIELGLSFTGFQPYKGVSIPISFPDPPGTVYGGTLDVISGVLTVNKGMLVKNTATMNNQNEDYPGWTNSGIRAIVGSGKNATIESMLNIGTKFGVNTFGNNDTLFLAKSAYGKTKEEWIALAMDVQIIAELAEPLTYQLTPEEVETLIGDNTVYTDADTMEVMFYQYNDVI